MPDPSPRTAERARHSTAVENYLKTIYSMSPAGEAPVPTSELADRLEVTSGSVSAMLKKLDGMGLVDHAPYHGVHLTESGRRDALDVVRRHRLVELFLAEMLDIPWERVHDEAEELEHSISDYLLDAIDEKLGRPRLDPHGDPIPTPELTVPTDDTLPLSAIDDGRAVEICRVSDLEPEMLAHLSRTGIALRDVVVITAREPFDGPLMLEVGGATAMVSRRLADAIRVRPVGSG